MSNYYKNDDDYQDWEYPDQEDIDALDHIDVGFHPGTNYSPTGKTGQDHIRLCYGYNEPEDITEGISRLADFLHKEGVLDS